MNPSPQLLPTLFFFVHSMTKDDQVVFTTIVTQAINTALDTRVPKLIEAAIKKTVPGMIEAGIQKTVPYMIKDAIEQNNHVLKLELRDEIYAMNKAMENRLVKKIDDTRREIVSDIGDILDSSILPQITELQFDVARLKQPAIA